jgi:outer membrane translocation and assembly module TamA
LGLQEDFRLGPIATLRVYPAWRGLVSTRSLLGVNALASYALEVGTGYLKLEAGHNVELSTPESTDARITLRTRFTSPRMALGRFVSDAYFVNTYRNYSRLFFSLDNTTRLRGYRARPDISNDLFGTGVIAHNLEFRSRPLQIFSTLLGVAIFHDIGDAFYDLSEIHLKHSTGVGVRFLAPQLDRDVLRVDLGIPLPPRSAEGEFTINAAFGQAFDVP